MAVQDSVWEKRKRLFEVSLNPFPNYRILRETTPIFYNEECQWWEIFRYQDVRRILTDYTTFSSNVMLKERDLLKGSGSFNDQDMGQAAKLSSTDPPHHRRLRSLIAQAFTPRAIAQLSSYITVIVNELLDKVASAGQMDVIEDFSYPLPLMVTAQMLGICPDRYAQFKRWSDDDISMDEERQRRAFQEMNEYFQSVIAERRTMLQNDLVSTLVTALTSGKALTEPELLSLCTLLLMASGTTTASLIGNALLCFDEHPEIIDELRTYPSLMPSAIEEVLRYLSPLQHLFRVATVDTTIGDEQIKAGQILVLCIGSANRDEVQFSQPDHFDIRRTPNHHLAFGQSIHVCIGAPLARLVSRIALETLLQRFTEIKRVREIPLQTIYGFLGVKNLPITFSQR